MSWLKKVMPARIRTEGSPARKRSVPEGLWEKCDSCGVVLYRPELEENLEVSRMLTTPIPRPARLAGSWTRQRRRIGAAFGPRLAALPPE